MATKTGIEWTDSTWNPVRGCSRVSEGCRNCYAERVAARFSGDFYNIESKGDLAPFHGFAKLTASGPRWTGKVEIVEKHLADPIKWREPKRIFVNSMSDLFHEALPDEAIDRVFAVMALCPQHIFQVLTKRPQRMRDYLSDDEVGDRVDAYVWEMLENRVDPNDRRSDDLRATAQGLTDGPLPNCWLGVSVEDQKTADERIPLLLRTPAAVRFVSYEPALGPVDLTTLPSVSGIGRYLNALNDACIRGSDILGRLDWLICGGESGPDARPMHPDWARSVRDQCLDAGVPFFFKQNGEYASVSEVAGPGRHHHFPDGATVRRVGKKAAGALLDGQEYKEFPA